MFLLAQHELVNLLVDIFHCFTHLHIDQYYDCCFYKFDTKESKSLQSLVKLPL